MRRGAKWFGLTRRWLIDVALVAGGCLQQQWLWVHEASGMGTCHLTSDSFEESEASGYQVQKSRS